MHLLSFYPSSKNRHESQSWDRHSVTPPSRLFPCSLSSELWLLWLWSFKRFIWLIHSERRAWYIPTDWQRIGEVCLFFCQIPRELTNPALTENDVKDENIHRNLTLPRRGPFINIPFTVSPHSMTHNHYCFTASWVVCKLITEWATHAYWKCHLAWLFRRRHHCLKVKALTAALIHTPCWLFPLPNLSSIHRNWGGGAKNKTTLTVKVVKE